MGYPTVYLPMKLVISKKGIPLSKEVQYASQSTTKAHGRIEKTFSYWFSQELNDYLNWPYAAQVFSD